MYVGTGTVKVHSTYVYCCAAASAMQCKYTAGVVRVQVKGTRTGIDTCTVLYNFKLLVPVVQRKKKMTTIYNTHSYRCTYIHTYMYVFMCTCTPVV